MLKLLTSEDVIGKCDLPTIRRFHMPRRCQPHFRYTTLTGKDSLQPAKYSCFAVITT